MLKSWLWRGVEALRVYWADIWRGNFTKAENTYSILQHGCKCERQLTANDSILVHDGSNDSLNFSSAPRLQQSGIPLKRD